MKKIIVPVLLIILFSCNKKELFKGPNSYSDNFESYTFANDLIDGNNKNWSFFQKTYSENSIEVDTTIFRSGRKSITFKIAHLFDLFIC